MPGCGRELPHYELEYYYIVQSWSTGQQILLQPLVRLRQRKETHLHRKLCRKQIPLPYLQWARGLNY